MSKFAVALICNLSCFSALSVTVRGTDYRISTLNEDIVSPCDEFPENYLTSVMDLSQLSFELLEDDNVHITGKLIITRDIPEMPITFSAQVFKKLRGQWVNTIYNVQRDDFCFSLFNPAEIWYQVTKSVAKQYRVCPPKENFTVDLDMFTDSVITLPDRNSDGEYKIEAKIGCGSDPRDFVCFNMFIQAEKV